MSLLSEDTTAKGTFSGQESPQCCSQSRQDPRTYLPPGISQVAVKKSGKGKKGPGGRHPRMAVTFSGWISQKPAAAEPLLTPGSCPGTQSCGVGGMAASHVAEKHLSTYSHFPCLRVSICCLLSPAWRTSTLRLEVEVLFIPHLCSTQQWGSQPQQRWQTHAQSQGNPKVWPCHMKQVGAFNAERRLNCPASLSSLCTIMWILLHPKRKDRLILCAPQKLSHCTL